METTQAAVARLSLDAEIGERVHRLIWRQRISQTAFAANLGISQSTMSKKMRGERPWYAPELQTAASVLGVTVGYLFGESTDGGVGPAGIEPTTSTV
ncbi:helix-turn-helix domain-containing protein [Microbacterium proteolyticum]|uniref:helix-turn-helix domain-containing protein n=1 Tax=Microbacterium proteolyticum TaxID=1572644 RepID=UPI00345B902B